MYTLYFIQSDFILSLDWLFKTTALATMITVPKLCPFPYEDQSQVKGAYNKQ